MSAKRTVNNPATIPRGETTERREEERKGRTSNSTPFGEPNDVMQLFTYASRITVAGVDIASRIGQISF